MKRLTTALEQKAFQDDEKDYYVLEAYASVFGNHRP